MDDKARIATERIGDAMGDCTPAIKFILSDHLGSSNVLIDASNAALVNREEYYPFGETSFGSYAKKRYRFCGKEKDEESGLYYYGARYYMPWTCRFLSIDPLRAEYPYLTPYQYAHNRPVDFIDRNGEEGEPATSAGSQSPPPKVDNVKTIINDPVQINEIKNQSANPDPQLEADAYDPNRYVAGTKNINVVPGDFTAPSYNHPAGFLISDSQRDVSEQEKKVVKPKSSGFEEIIPIILKWEGGYVNDPLDHGGETNKGITMGTFQANAVKLLNVEPTSKNLKNLTVDQAKTLYKNLFWDSIRGDEIENKNLAFFLMDYEVLSGGNAVKMLQRVLNSMGEKLKVDGVMGNNTLKALKNHDQEDVYEKLKAARIEHYQNIVKAKPDQKRFLKGWLRRVNSF